MLADVNLQTWVWLWLATALYLLIRNWRAGWGVGLIFTYVMSFAAMHWIAGAMYLLPWYMRGNLELTAVGLKESTIGLIGLTLGTELGRMLLRRRELGGSLAPREAIDPRVANFLLAAGLVTYVVIAPIGARIPSLAAVLSTGSSVIVAAVALKCWNAWLSGSPSRIVGWLTVSLSFPLVTVVTQGFLGFGFAAMLILFAFVASFAGPKKSLIVVALASWYLGMSVYVTYMRDRTDIRDVVWTGASLDARVDRLVSTFTDMEWFDLREDQHLRRVDGRLNQNYLIGAAAANLEPGFIEFARGSTVFDAVLALIPRALWPDKPMMAGSGDLVSRFTGMRFPEGTSVGIGHVMESYVNFGTAGVAVGLFLIGTLMTIVDRVAAAHLHAGNAQSFFTWYLPGLSLLLLGGSFVEMTSSAAAGLLMALMLNRLMDRFLVPARPWVPEPPPIGEVPS